MAESTGLAAGVHLVGTVLDEPELSAKGHVSFSVHCGRRASFECMVLAPKDGSANTLGTKVLPLRSGAPVHLIARPSSRADSAGITFFVSDLVN